MHMRDVIRAVLPGCRRAWTQRELDIPDRRQRCIVDLHLLGGVLGQINRFGHDKCDRITDVVDRLFSLYPRSSENLSGVPRQPIDLVIVGSEEELTKALGDAGWLPMDTLSWKTLGKATGAVVRNEAYPQEPGTPAFWNNRPNDLAFEQPTAENTARKRYHVHVWSTPLVTSSGRNVWVANTHFDEGIKLTSALIVPTHMIDPAVDKVRDKVENELVQTGEASSSTIFQNVDPMLGQNEAGDSFFTDGKAYLIFLRPQ